MQFTKEKFLSFYPVSNPSKGASSFYDYVSNSLVQQEINTPLTLIGALGTARTEVGRDYLPITENLNYSADGLLKTFPAYFSRAMAINYAYKPQAIANKVYANRMGNGAESTGDGWKYRGRGYIQLTGRANYRLYGQKLGLDLENNPDLALEPKVAAKILVLYFKLNQCNVYCDLRNWKEVRRRVNGGSNGLVEFQTYVNSFISKL